MFQKGLIPRRASPFTEKGRTVGGRGYVRGLGGGGSARGMQAAEACPYAHMHLCTHAHTTHMHTRRAYSLIIWSFLIWA